LLDVDCFTGGNQISECIRDCVLTFVSRQLQNLYVHFVGHLLCVVFSQYVPCHPKRAGGKHFLAVSVVCEGARLANQRIDDVAIIDRRLVFSDQSRHDLDDMSLMSHRDLFGGHTHVDRLTNQPTGDRIRIGSHLNRAAFGDSHALQHVVRVEAFVGQSAEARSFFGESFSPIGVGSGNDLFHETHVLFAAGKLTTATKQQRLIEAIFDVSVG
jgi:hypothetical protein